MERRVRERIAELEWDTWGGSLEVGLGALGTRWEFSREWLRALCRLSRLYFLKNPLVNRGVMIQAVYVWGQGVRVTARHPVVQAVVRRFWEDPANQAELTAHRAQILKECDLQVDGNLFFALFRDPRTGQVRVRTIPVDEVEAILHNPEDRREPWWYQRRHVVVPVAAQAGRQGVRERVTYYPDWQLGEEEVARRAAELRQAVGGRGPGVVIEEGVRVLHVRVGGLSEMQFGVPETYQALDWAQAYRGFLEDWASLVKALSRFAFKLTVPNDPRALEAAKQVLETTVGVEQPVEGRPAPPAGSVWAGPAEFDLQPVRTGGAVVRAEDGRRLLLMVCAALGVPETFMGDVSVGTLATAESLDRPTELKFRARQTLWQDTLGGILQYVVRSAAAAGVDGLRWEPEGGVTWQGQEIDTYVDVRFPPILERDMTKVVDAVVDAATLRGRALAGVIDPETVTRLLLQAVDAGDIDKLVRKVYGTNGDVDAVDGG